MKTLFLLCIVFLATAGFAQAQALLRPGDSVELRLAGVPVEEMQAFGGSYTLDDSGSLNLPYIGSVKAAGMPPSQVQSIIEQKLVEAKIYTHPTITLVLPQGTRFVSVGGQVKAPGRVVYTSDLTVMSAINAAGGFTDYADQKKVRWTHEGKTTVLNARVLRNDPKQDTKIFPGDQIEVPQSWF